MRMKVSIVGITGYSGLELVRLLARHPKIDIVSVHARQHVGKKLSELYPHLASICDLVITEIDAESIMNQSELVFFATPSGLASQMAAPFVEAGFPVIDLSGDHRLVPHIYKEWYQKEPGLENIQEQFTYGLAETSQIFGKKFIANPGCYATATELALWPLVEAKVLSHFPIIVDAKSGLTGAGKSLTDSSHFVNVQDNYVHYKLNQHQHIPEIEQYLKQFDENVPPIQFSTALLPVNRGIVATIYVSVKSNVEEQDIANIYQTAYEGKPFVRLQEQLPHLHQVIGSNTTAIGFALNEKTGILTVVSVLDNLIKGAAGQAIQNMNLMMGWSEELGLQTEAVYF